MIVCSLIDIPAWGQLIVAVAALLVAILAFRSNKEIDEIINLTKEQKRQSDAILAQNEILIQSLGLQIESHVLNKKLISTSIRPHFVKTNELSSPQSVTIYLKNVGVVASKLNIINRSSGENWSTSIQGAHRIEKEGQVSILVSCPDGNVEGISFDLSYSADDTATYKQNIAKVHGGQFEIAQI